MFWDGGGWWGCAGRRVWVDTSTAVFRLSINIPGNKGCMVVSDL